VTRTRVKATQLSSNKIDEKASPTLDSKQLFGVSSTGRRVGTEKHLVEKARPEKK